ncbi:MAG: hydrogenase maturation protease, partial [Candidatus Acidiferrales bacterium]
EMNLSQKSLEECNPSPAVPSVLVVGIGNPLRADDAAGHLVAEGLGRRNLSFLKIVEHLGDGASLMALWGNTKTVIVVDAVVSGAVPGTIHRIDAIKDPLPVWLSEVSTHGLGLAQAVELARVMNQLPRRLIIYGIEGRSFEAGGELSSEVRAAVSQAVDRVVEEAHTDVRNP